MPWRTTGVGPGVVRRTAVGRSQNLLLVCLLIPVVAVGIGIAGSVRLTAGEMHIVWPVLATLSIFAEFSALLVMHRGQNPLGEIGFVYLGMAVLYTVLPAAKFILLRLDIPPGFDGLSFASLDPTPQEMGRHFWRQVLLIGGVAFGYLAVRGRRAVTRGKRYRLCPADERALLVLAAIVAGAVTLITALSGGVEAYVDHYTRLEALSGTARRFVYVLLAVKAGGYYVILVLLFGRYQKYKTLLPALTLAMCAYELIYSHGSRIAAFSLILAYIGLYNVQVRPIRIRAAVAVLAVLALAFTVIEQIRQPTEGSLIERLGDATTAARGSEFAAVYVTGYHLYHERQIGALPSPPTLMAFYEFIALVPFLDHTRDHPMYWYAREYFPSAAVPPATMGIVAMSAVWGGEVGLLIISLLNGCLYALVVRWFEQRREKWWALATYVFLFATCVMTLKYSLLYQLIPLAQTLVPMLLVAAMLIALTREKTQGPGRLAS